MAQQDRPMNAKERVKYPMFRADGSHMLLIHFRMAHHFCPEVPFHTWSHFRNDQKAAGRPLPPVTPYRFRNTYYFDRAEVVAWKIAGYPYPEKGGGKIYGEAFVSTPLPLYPKRSVSTMSTKDYQTVSSKELQEFKDKYSLKVKDLNQLIGVTTVSAWLNQGIMPKYMVRVMRDLRFEFDKEATREDIIALVRIPSEKAEGFQAVIGSMGMKITSMNLL